MSPVIGDCFHSCVERESQVTFRSSEGAVICHPGRGQSGDQRGRVWLPPT